MLHEKQSLHYFLHENNVIILFMFLFVFTLMRIGHKLWLLDDFPENEWCYHLPFPLKNVCLGVREATICGKYSLQKIFIASSWLYSHWHLKLCQPFSLLFLSLLYLEFPSFCYIPGNSVTELSINSKNPSDWNIQRWTRKYLSQISECRASLLILGLVFMSFLTTMAS